ncbi:MAG: SH3 domain-containing protein [Pseudomonadota bacterium]|nr:SH3 domain-containing protein [Pseudomonadota bacterium]
MQKYSKSAAAVAFLYISMLAVNVFAGIQKTTMATDEFNAKTLQVHKKLESNAESSATAMLGRVVKRPKPIKITEERRKKSNHPTNKKVMVASTLNAKNPAKASNIKAQAVSKSENKQFSNQTNFSQVSTYWKSSTDGKKTGLTKQEMKLYAEPNQKGRVVATVKADQNFSVEQGDWVKVKTTEGKVGWSLVKDVEENINSAWNAEYQVIINGPSSNYSVTKISPEERLKKQQAMRERQMQKMKKLSKLWEEDFFAFNDEKDTETEINNLKNQVLALNEKIKGMQKDGEISKSNT